MANQLEQLIGEWLEHQGYFVRRNIRVGKRPAGGHEGELDLVAYHPRTKHLLHIEASLDAAPWPGREARYAKKFLAGKKYIPTEVLPWLTSADHQFEQWAIIWGSNTTHQEIGGGIVVPVGDFYRRVVKYVRDMGPPSAEAISENGPLLRSIHYAIHYMDHPNRKA